MPQNEESWPPRSKEMGYEDVVNVRFASKPVGSALQGAVLTTMEESLANRSS